MDRSSRCYWRLTTLRVVSSTALFCELENTRSYFLLMRGLIRSCGIPIALYADRHAVFKRTPPSEIAAAPTQFSRAMDELGVQLIFARSPQAKGRVERAAGTLQDRLVTELRLAGAATIDDANRALDDFLPRFNERFRVPARRSETAYRVLDPGTRLGATLCLKYRRGVARDNTVKYRRRTLRLLPDKGRPSYAGSVVDALEGLDALPGGAARGAHRPLTGSAAPSKYPAQLRYKDRTRDRPQPLHQRCQQKIEGRSGDTGHNTRIGQTRRRCRPRRRCKSSQGCDSTIQKARQRREFAQRRKYRNPPAGQFTGVTFSPGA